MVVLLEVPLPLPWVLAAFSPADLRWHHGRFEKLEIIVDGMIKIQKEEIERGKDIHNQAYIHDLMKELRGFQRIYGKMLDIKNNGPSVTDEMIERVWRRP